MPTHCLYLFPQPVWEEAASPRLQLGPQPPRVTLAVLPHAIHGHCLHVERATDPSCDFEFLALCLLTSC